MIKNGVFIDIAASIKNKNGEADIKYRPGEMSAAIDALEISHGSGGYDEGFEAGRQAEYDAFWNVAQNNGDSAGVNYYYKFAYSGMWTDANFNPKYPLVCSNASTSAQQMFRANTRITDTKVPIQVLGTSAASAFYGCTALVTIQKLIVHSGVDFTSTFFNCIALENIEFEGTIGKGVDFSSATKFTRSSIESVMSALSTTTTDKSVTFVKSAVNKAFETSEGANDGSTSTEWTTLVNTKTNWTINLV